LFIDESQTRLDRNLSCLYPNIVANQYVHTSMLRVSHVQLVGCALGADRRRDYTRCNCVCAHRQCNRQYHGRHCGPFDHLCSRGESVQSSGS
jgi:hypothetical protein